MTVGELDVGKGRTAARVGSAAWLLLIAWPLWSFLASGPGAPAVVAALGLVAVFAACWLPIMWRMLSPLPNPPLPWALAGLTMSGLALLPLFGAPWAYTSFVFAISAFAASLRVRAFAMAVVATVVVEVLALLWTGAPMSQVWWVPLIIVVQTAAVSAMKSMGLLIARLNAARLEVARLAVENERLRFARDLHDTLGHTLTSITIRSQLAARLATTDTERAAHEMTEVEQTARRALDEVRHAIAGYRAPSLSEELETATRNLGVAGIEVTVSPADGPIPPAAEAQLAWAVREAATNVLRHSRARHCHIRLHVNDSSAAVEVLDDGHPTPHLQGDHHPTAPTPAATDPPSITPPTPTPATTDPPSIAQRMTNPPTPTPASIARPSITPSTTDPGASRGATTAQRRTAPPIPTSAATDPPSITRPSITPPTAHPAASRPATTAQPMTNPPTIDPAPSPPATITQPTTTPPTASSPRTMVPMTTSPITIPPMAVGGRATG
ncbi:sensor histidine kinase [[Actinomadura] parvosata subsp. kistnae]|uniref:sensor histidine kinase n=1 Tax=[Actinomadura] parvosata TaxID=1955412 RepID=UPI000D27F4EC|nr:sensor histidine kinase [Actinomadura parvosata subsp. kistnae]